jgi:CheY-like chemotaxis protein
MLIDDDPLVRLALAMLLREAGHTVEEADGGDAGLALLSERQVDVVLTDLRMPGLTGWDVARAVKAKNPYLPVILVTGSSNSIAVDQPERAFVDAVLPKPCRIEELQAVIGRLTGETACAAVQGGAGR